MLSTGMTREIDPVGRVVLPKELRRTYGIETGDPVEIFSDERGIRIRKYKSTTCIFCFKIKNPVFYKGQFICEDCAISLKLGTVKESSKSEISSIET